MFFNILEDSSGNALAEQLFNFRAVSKAEH